MISKQQVQHIAKLARFGLTKKEIKNFQKELSLILNYIEKLKEIDVSGVEPMSQPLKIKNVMRKDEKAPKSKAESLKFLELMPETKEGYLKVKSILK